jgi:beta-glucanase (GH16 family)
MHLPFALAVALVVALGSIPEPAAQSVRPLSDPDGHWILLPAYSDEFEGDKLDTSKWTSRVKSWGKSWSWSPDNVWVKDGHLTLRMQYQPNTRDGMDLEYTSGIVESVAPPLDGGYFEARIKGTDRFPGVCPAFWLNDATDNLWTEIDIVEMQQHARAPNRLDFTAHLWRVPGLTDLPQHLHMPSYTPDWNPATHYHVYGLLWGKHWLKWYVDGQLVAVRANNHFDQPLKVILSMGLRPPLKENPSASGFPTTMSVDYVRVWKPAP